MNVSDQFITNAVGRSVPSTVNEKTETPFKGVGQHKPNGRRFAPNIVSCADFPADGNKLLSSLEA
ncbi:MAG: hypothetical protein ABJJ14_03860, partial [Cyclobacteriaceae bacterium]